MIEKNKVVLRLTPSEALLVSQAFILAAGVRQTAGALPGLSRWYTKLASVIEFQANRIAESNSVGCDISAEEVQS